MVVHDEEPFNAETSPAALAEGPVTATDAFYVRGHAAVPEIDPEAWRLHVHGLVERELDLSLVTLREAFPEREVTATLQCAGNRRAGLIAIRDLPGEEPWGPGATGTATWSGVALSEVLALACPLRDAAHVGFEGADLCPEREARSAVRRLDPVRQGVSSRGPARVGDERAAPPAHPRRAAARSRTRLHRRTQRQMASADRGPLEAVGGVLPARRLQAVAAGREAGSRARGCRSVWSRSTQTCCLRPTGRRSRPVRSRCAATRSPVGSGTSLGSTSRSTAERAGRKRSCSRTSDRGPGDSGG